MKDEMPDTAQLESQTEIEAEIQEVQESQDQEIDQPQREHSREVGVCLVLDHGLRMLLDMSGSDGKGEGRRIAAELIGYVHFEFLILRLPWIPGLRSALLPGSNMTVRFVNAGDMCGFQTEILSCATKPALIVFLRYPEVVEKVPLRQYRRVHCALPSQLHSRRGDSSAIIADLSKGGCKVVVDVRGQAGLRQTVVGDEIVIQASLSADGTMHGVTCLVRHVDLEPSRMVLGVSFAEADKDFWERLEFFLNYSELL